MTEQQRKAIEILNGIRSEKKQDGEQVISEDDYFFLMSFVIEKPQVTTIPTPYPVTTPWQPIIPLYEHDWRVTCSETNTEQL